MVNRIKHIFGVHDWIPRYVVVKDVMVSRGHVCSVCKKERDESWFF